MLISTHRKKAFGPTERAVFDSTHEAHKPKQQSTISSRILFFDIMVQTLIMEKDQSILQMSKNSTNWTRQSGGASRAIIIGFHGVFWVCLQNTLSIILTWTIDDGKFLVDVIAE